MERLRQVLIVLLCLGIAVTGRGPVTELASSWHGQEHAHAKAQDHPNALATHHDGRAVAHVHSHGGAHDGGAPQGAADPADDSCACGCGMGTCAAMPANLSMQHPVLARIELQIDLPAPRASLHAPTLMAPQLRPPIG